ncbi:MAG: hypothetical protein KAI83_08085 [Thiomargarita sp.]|nr:hypothetical protein [Thiomargarita sp.]
MKTVGIWIVLLSGLWSVHALALDAGWINSFDSQRENYLIKRGNEKVPVEIFTVLQIGDEISVNTAQHFIELILRGGTVQVTHENSPFKIDVAHQLPEGEMSSWVKQCIESWHKLTHSKVNKVGQETLSMPLLANVKSGTVLIAGKRPLYLQWYRGTPPYQVQIKQRDKVLLTQETFVPAIKTEAITFKANTSYRVVVTDANHQKFTGGFRVVKSVKLPSYPKLSQKLPDNFYRLLQATCLAMEKEKNGELSGKFFFEAYQQVSEIIGYLPAKMLKEALAQGDALVRRGVRGHSPPKEEKEDAVVITGGIRGHTF